MSGFRFVFPAAGLRLGGQTLSVTYRALPHIKKAVSVQPFVDTLGELGIIDSKWRRENMPFTYLKVRLLQGFFFFFLT